MQPIPLIPYFETSRYRVQTMIELAHIIPGEFAVDLGSGDGRILIALAQAGAKAHGYELDEKLIAKSIENSKHNNLSEHISISKQNFWEVNLSPYTIVMVYPMPDVMEKLEDKLQSELSSGSRVLLNYYPFPNWKHVTKKDNIYLYHHD